MLLKLTHQTDLNYSQMISETVMELRMCPRQEQGQHRLSFDLAIGPPTAVTSYFDWLGNQVHVYTVSAFHRQVRIVATSIVETDRPAADPTALSDRWPAPPGADYTIYDYLRFDGPVVDSPQLCQLVASLNAVEGMNLGELSGRMLGLIHDRFAYEKGITTAASPITDVLEQGRGVCQDFTHLMIGMARSLGIPARYVSGMVFDASGKYRGAAQTHAWCELLFPSTGWIGFDPTNNCPAGEPFVAVAVGRHYRDVPPNRGVFRGAAAETMQVSVQTEQLSTIPAQLAAERTQSLPIPCYSPQEIQREERRRLLEEQQQQQQ